MAPNSRAKSQQVRVARRRGTGPILGEDIGPHRRGGREPARELDALHRAAPVRVGGKVVGLHRRRRERVRGLDPHVSARCRPQLAHAHRESGKRMRLGAGQVRRQRGEVKLDIGPRRFRQRAREQSALVDADRQRTRPPQQPLQSDLRRAPRRCEVVVGRDRLRAFEDEAQLQVVLQVLAHAGKIVHDRNAELLQQGCRTDARQLQQLRALQRTGGKYHFARGGHALRLAACRYSTPVARVPSNSTRVACAPTSTARFGAPLARAAGSATAELQRRPFFVNSW